MLVAGALVFGFCLPFAVAKEQAWREAVEIERAMKAGMFVLDGVK